MPVLGKIADWFGRRPQDATALPQRKATAMGLLVAQEMPAVLVDVLATLAAGVLKGEGTVVVPQAGAALGHAQHSLLQQLGLGADITPSIQYGQRILRPGFHAMATPTWHEQELLAGFGATGVDVILVVSDDFAVPAHPCIPVLQLGTKPGPHADWWPSTDGSSLDKLVGLIQQTLSRTYIPLSTAAQHVDFQISRGWRGISL